MHRVPGDMSRPGTVWDPDLPAGGLAASAATATAPRVRLEFELHRLCHLD
jgi:hypothetical protein